MQLNSIIILVGLFILYNDDMKIVSTSLTFVSN